MTDALIAAGCFFPLTCYLLIQGKFHAKTGKAKVPIEPSSTTNAQH